MDPIIKQLLNTNRVEGSHHTHVSLIQPRGKFNFNRETLEQFWKAYCDALYTHERVSTDNNARFGAPNVFGIAEKPQHYLPIIVDVDLCVKKDQDIEDVPQGLYTEEQLKSVISIYQTILKEIVQDYTSDDLKCIVLEKKLYQQTRGSNDYLKNGFHLHFPYLFLHKDDQEKHLIPKVKQAIKNINLFDNLGIEDSGNVIDKQCCKVPWLLYGSRKEGIEAKPYKVTKIYDSHLNIITLDEAFKNYKIYDKDEELIPIKDNVAYYLPRILSIIPYNRKTKEVKHSVKKSLPVESTPQSQTKPRSNTRYNQPVDESLIRSLIMLCSDFRADSYEDWIKLGWILHKEFNGEETGLELWKTFSQKCEEKYDEVDCETKWEKMIDREGNEATLGTLHFWASQDNPDRYQELMEEIRKKDGKDSYKHIPKDPKYKECQVQYVHGLQDIKYSTLFKDYNTIFMKGNMGSGKTKGIDEIIPLYEKIVFISSKRSLAYDYHNKHPDFELYDELKGTIDIDKHKKIVIQVDSLCRLVGKPNLLIVDEFVDLSSQLLQSRSKNEVISVFQEYLRGADKKLIMDANLDRIDFFEELIDFNKSIFIKDQKRYHTDKNIIVINDEYQLQSSILEQSTGRMFIPSDSKKFIEGISTLYKTKYPYRKVLVLTSDTSYDDRRQDFSDYDVIFCSPTITAGVSHIDKIDHVYGFYTKRSINSWSATQQLLRCRNWKTALIYFGINNEVETPIAEEEVEQYISDRFSSEIEDLSVLTINRLSKDIKKNFAYYMYLEHIKRMKRSKRLFKYYFLKIMKKHGILYEEDNETCTKEEEKSKQVLKETLRKIDGDNKEALIIDTSIAIPTKADLENFSSKQFDKIKEPVLQYLWIKENYGIFVRNPEWVRTYIDKHMVYKNICSSLNDRNVQIQLDGETFSTISIREQNMIQRRLLCQNFLKHAGFTGLLDNKEIIISYENLNTYIKTNLKKIQVIFNSHKSVELGTKDNLMKFVNAKLKDVFGIKLQVKKLQQNKVKFVVHHIQGMDIWSTEVCDENKPCIIEKLTPLLPR
jgi:hypothetical protein